MIDNHKIMWYYLGVHKVKPKRKEVDGMENSIRGAVFSMFNSISAFANAIGWGRNKASRILNGTQKPTIEDMEQIADCLKISDAQRFVSIFFPEKFTM